MKNVLIAFLAAFIGLGLGVADAEAKRLGGGKSFGMQRSAPVQAPAKPAAPPAAAPAQPATQPAATGGSRWLGPLAGLAAGLGLAALFSHLGLAEELATVVLVLLLLAAVLLLFRLLSRRSAPPQRSLAYAEAGRAAPLQFEAPAAAGGAASIRLPAGFDAEAFLRQAKLNFIRLQAAHDRGDLEDLRNFTTPEVFAEIRLQMAERGAAPQQTDVVTLDAELLELVEEGRQYVASVRFSGLIRETADAAPQPFDEVWHLTKPVDGSRGWVVAGIQQRA